MQLMVNACHSARVMHTTNYNRKYNTLKYNLGGYYET